MAYDPNAELRVMEALYGRLVSWGENLPQSLIREMAAAAVAALRPADVDETQKLPPIGDTVRRRPPVPPAVRELKGAELLRALADELDGEGLSIEDLDDPEDPLSCHAVLDRGDGVEWWCGHEAGHKGPHEVHGRRW